MLRIHEDEMIVDNFAGGGGASLGIEQAIGRSPDVAINHDPKALAIHAANHPNTKHLVGDIWEYKPLEITGGRRVALLWASPDCRHHSRAKGGKPVSARVRALAWIVPRWATVVKPRVIILENVEEFLNWGPINRKTKRPDPARKGQTFRAWVRRLERLGYVVEHRMVRACDFGSPTIRKRLFVIARCDGEAIVWPTASHGTKRGPKLRVAAECIDWTIPVPSIFGRKKPLAEKTLARIARGVRKFVLDSGKPFLAPVTHAGDLRVHSMDEPVRTITGANRGELMLVAPTLVQTSYGERKGQKPRVLDLHKPLTTVVAGGQKHGLVAAFLARHYSERPTGGWNGGVPLDVPAPTITARDSNSLAAVHLVKFYGTCPDGQAVDEPMPTVTATGWHLGAVKTFLERFEGTCTDGQITVRVDGELYVLVDIGMRMLQPHELAAAQGFPAGYRFAVKYLGKTLSKTAQIKAVGNSVCPHAARAHVAANFSGRVYGRLPARVRRAA